MRHIVLPILTIAAAVLISAVVVAGDAASGDKSQTSFKIAFVNQIEPRSEQALVLSKATKARVAALRKELAADPVLTSKLRARGIQIRHVIGRDRAVTGVTIIYVRWTWRTLPFVGIRLVEPAA